VNIQHCSFALCKFSFLHKI